MLSPLAATAVSVSATWGAAPKVDLSPKVVRFAGWIVVLGLFAMTLVGDGRSFLLSSEPPRPARTASQATVQLVRPELPSQPARLPLREGVRGQLGMLRAQILRSELSGDGLHAIPLLVNPMTQPQLFDPLSLRISPSADSQSYSTEPISAIELAPGQIQTLAPPCWFPARSPVCACGGSTERPRTFSDEPSRKDCTIVPSSCCIEGAMQATTDSIATKHSGLSLRIALGVWLVLLLIGQGLGADTVMRKQTERDWNAHALTFSPYDVWRSVRTFLSDCDDMRRYYAYANALLGKPYYRYFVRSSDSWREEFHTGKPTIPNDNTLVVPDKPILPYRDYLVEYPPGVFLATLPPALLLPAGDFGDAYVRLFTLEMSIFLAASTILTLRLRRFLPRPGGLYGPPTAWMWLLSGVGIFCLGTAAAHRFDPVVAFLLLAVALAVFEERFTLSGALLALAVICKGIPLLLAPVWLLFLSANAQRSGQKMPWVSVGRVALGGLLTGLAFVLPLYHFTGLSMLEALRYHADRPLQVESTGSAILGTLQVLLPGTLRSTFSFGSHNIVVVGETLFGLQTLFLRMHGPVMIIGLGAMLGYAWLRQRSWVGNDVAPRLAELTLRLLCGVLVLYMVSGRVFSPQYLTWVLPLALFLSLRVSRWMTAVFLIALTLTHIICRALGGAFWDCRPWAFAILLVRNTLLFGWCVALLTARISGSVPRHALPLS